MNRTWRFAIALAGMLTVTYACGPKTVAPPPVVTAPKFPDFMKPPVPPALSESRALAPYDRGWLFLQSGDLKTAGVEIGRALELSPGFYPAEAASGYLDLARKDPKSALGHFDRVLAEHGDYGAALVGRGDALVALDRGSDAIAAFDEALRVDPSLTDVRRRVEVLRFRDVGQDLTAARQAARANDLDASVRAYQTAIASSPDSAFLYRELGDVERRKGDLDLALTHLRKAAALDSTDAMSLAEIGDILSARDDLTGALEAYDRSLALEPSDAVKARRDAVGARAELARLPEQYRAIDRVPQVTRADLAALIGVRLAPVLKTIQSTDPGLVTDVRNNWAEAWITGVAAAGVIEPFPNHTFQPRSIVRRADLADAVSRLLRSIAPPSSIERWESRPMRFPDLARTHLAFPAASLAVSSGAMTVGPDGNFEPSLAVTGAEAVAVIERLQAMANSSGSR